MQEKINSLIREYAWSAFITFISAFLLAVLPALGSLPPEQGAIFALVMTGFRAGSAALINFFATKGKTISSKPQS